MQKKLKDHEIAKLILLAALLFGGFLRFSPVLQAGFPINDGGMFYSMIEELHANQFILPKYTSYNLLDIPYTYPPLGFYLGALLKALGIDTLLVLMFLPATVSTLSILAFFRLAYQFFEASWLKSSMAALAFALLPHSFSTSVMGGGLTRSLGQFFLLLFLASFLQSCRNPKSTRAIVYSGIFGGLSLLSHPETSVHALTTGGLIWLFFARNRAGILSATIIAILVLAVASPWWAVVLWQHGPTPFANALQTGGHSLFFSNLGKLISFQFGEEPLFPVITAFGIIAILYQLARKEYFLSLWMFLPFLTHPRSPGAIAIYPLLFLFSIAVTEILLPALQKSDRRKEDNHPGRPLLQKSVFIVAGTITVYLLLAGLTYSTCLSSYHLPASERETMQWIKNHTPEQSRFLMLSLTKEPMLFNSAEWFPTLTNRHSLLTLQGREWTQGDDFSEMWQSYGQWNTCLYKDIHCLESLTRKNNIEFEYIYISTQTGSCSTETKWKDMHLPMINELQQSAQYHLLYENEGAILFSK